MGFIGGGAAVFSKLESLTMSKNISPLVADMREHLAGHDKVEGSLGALTVHLADSLKSVLSCEYADDNKSGRDVFTVAEYILDKPRNDDGSASQLQQSARNVAMMTTLFGFESYNIPHPAVTARDKALPAAIALSRYYRDSDGKLTAYVMAVPGTSGGKRNVIGGIPARDMFDLVNPDGSLTASGKATFSDFHRVFYREKKRMPKDDGELLAYMLAFPVETSGRGDPAFRNVKGQSLKAVSTSTFIKALTERAIKDGVLPKPIPKKPKAPVDSGTDLVKSVKLLTDWVAMLNAPDGEVDVAPNAEREAMLDKLAEAWACYRANNPRGA